MMCLTIGYLTNQAVAIVCMVINKQIWMDDSTKFDGVPDPRYVIDNGTASYRQMEAWRDEKKVVIFTYYNVQKYMDLIKD